MGREGRRRMRSGGERKRGKGEEEGRSGHSCERWNGISNFKYNETGKDVEKRKSREGKREYTFVNISSIKRENQLHHYRPTTEHLIPPV